jgi:hypothetical protein
MTLSRTAVRRPAGVQPEMVCREHRRKVVLGFTEGDTLRTQPMLRSVWMWGRASALLASSPEGLPPRCVTRPSGIVVDDRICEKW